MLYPKIRNSFLIAFFYSILIHALLLIRISKWNASQPRLTRIAIITESGTPICKSKHPQKPHPQIDHQQSTRALKTHTILPVATNSNKISNFKMDSPLLERTSQISKYSMTVRERIESFLDYPLSLKHRQIQGNLSIQLFIRSTGEIEQIRIIQTSGYTELDELAMEAIHRAGPFTPFIVAEMEMERISLHIPFYFQIK